MIWGSHLFDARRLILRQTNQTDEEGKRGQLDFPRVDEEGL